MAKPILMMLGSYHLNNPGRDYVNFKADDVFQPHRQNEIEQLVKQLKEFKPTKIAVEVEAHKDSELNEKFERYLKNEYQLERNEVYQIGFRVAKAMKHSKVYPVDWFELSLNKGADTDFVSFAEVNCQEYLLKDAFRKAQHLISQAEVVQEKGSLVDLYRFSNQPWNLRKEHQLYFTLARVGSDNRYPGANWVQDWYGRNLKIFINLTRVIESNDRVLLIIGLGHVRILQQFARDSGHFNLANPLKYLTLSE